MYKRVIYFFVIVLIIGYLFHRCGAKTAGKIVQVKDSTIAILSHIGDTVLENGGGKKTYYQFEEIDMNEALQGQQIIKSYLESNPVKVKWDDKSINKDTYNRNYKQFIGLKDQDNHKIIWVNSLCNTSPGWEQKLIKVMGGGTCYFNLKVNLETEKVFDVFVNGPK